jgi:hypothetical protein
MANPIVSSSQSGDRSHQEMIWIPGGVFIDLFSGVTPEVVKPLEFVVLTAVLASGTRCWPNRAWRFFTSR